MAYKIYKQNTEERDGVEGIETTVYFTGYPHPLRLIHFIQNEQRKRNVAIGYQLCMLVDGQWVCIATQEILNTYIPTVVKDILEWDDDNEDYVRRKDIDDIVNDTAHKFEELIVLMFGKEKKTK